MKVNLHLSIGFVGAEHRDTLELDDDATDEDIESEVECWANNYVETWWEKEEEG
jgi:hypothetical protein